MATLWAISRMRRCAKVRSLGSTVRSVPRMCTWLQITLLALPPSMVPKVSTRLFSGETLRETRVCSVEMICAAQTMASTLFSG